MAGTPPMLMRAEIAESQRLVGDILAGQSRDSSSRDFGPAMERPCSSSVRLR